MTNTLNAYIRLLLFNLYIIIFQVIVHKAFYSSYYIKATSYRFYLFFKIDDKAVFFLHYRHLAIRLCTKRLNHIIIIDITIMLSKETNSSRVFYKPFRSCLLHLIRCYLILIKKKITSIMDDSQ